MNTVDRERPRPNLFIIGAAKSGTTSLHHHLHRHPDIQMSEPKEPGFFVEGLDYYPSDVDWYLDLFTEGANVKYRGESSTHYTKLPTYPGVPHRIASFCDEAKLIYLMRDPIDRAISHYWHNVRQNVEFRSPLRALKENHEYRSYGDYSRQLSAYFQDFDRDDIYITTFERLIASRGLVTADIYRWLDLEPDAAQDSLPKMNSKPKKIRRSLAGQRIGEFLQSEVWDSLSPLVPQGLKNVAKSLTRETVRPSDYPLEPVIDYLRPWAVKSMEKTARLLDREFDEWSTTRGDQ